MGERLSEHDFRGGLICALKLDGVEYIPAAGDWCLHNAWLNVSRTATEIGVDYDRSRVGDFLCHPHDCLLRSERDKGWVIEVSENYCERHFAELVGKENIWNFRYLAEIFMGGIKEYENMIAYHNANL